MNVFDTCLVKNADNKSALGCCMTGCSENPNCQEKCIEDYNALIPVKETFLLGYRVNKGLTFLFAVILFHILVIIGKVDLPIDKKQSILFITIVYCVLYYFINYIL